MYQDLRTQLEESRYLRFPMKEDPRYAGQTRWLQKPVTNERVLPLARDFARVTHTGVGHIGVSRDVARSPEGSVCLTMPLSTAIINPTHRAYNIPEVFYPLDREDLTAYNRITFWVYIDAPGVRSLFTHVSLNNAGEHVMPLPGRFEGTHHTTVPTGAWTQVVWEFPSIYRDCVTSFSVGVYACGGLQSAAGTQAKVYLDDMRIATVDAENYKGFALRKNAIAYSHCGYKQGSAKHALVQGLEAESFSLADASGKEVFTGKTVATQEGFRLLDFSAFDEPGRYTLRVGGLTTQPFSVGPDAYLDLAWKTLNFFRFQRCGCDLPFVHTECHLDATCTHPDGRKLTVAGGWHDAADLTQGTGNTVECAFAMIELAERPGIDADLREQLLDEARWGLNWVMRTRFGDGYRHGGMIIGLWTENYMGDKDDMDNPAVNRPGTNFQAAALCARGYTAFRFDRVFAEWCLRCAKEDYQFAVDAVDISPTANEPSLFSQAAIAAAELYKITKEQRYLDEAARHARRVIDCQQLEPKTEWTTPLRGFFYETSQKARTLAFFHQSTEHLPLQATSLLLELAPSHADAPLWKESILAYGDLIRALEGFGSAYGLLPSFVYEVDNTDYSGLYHEGDRSVGQPTIEEYNAQVRGGIRLSDTHYLRRFPVAYQFRGFHAIHMSRAKAIFYANRVLQDAHLRDVATRQLEWILGYNPFAMSSIAGVGYDFPPLYSGMILGAVGASPVGFETFENEDEPYFPMQNHCTYKEIWVHTTCRLLWLMADIL